MKKSQRINTIVELKKNQEKKALEELGKSQTKRQEMLTQLENLQQYRQEYLDKYKTLGNAGMSAKRIIDYRAFISKIDQAIEDQKRVFASVESELLRTRKMWENAHHKTKSLEKVQAVAEKEEAKIEAKHEQNDQDERASRAGKFNL
jgi:flagellar FliJ protein